MSPLTAKNARPTAVSFIPRFFGSLSDDDDDDDDGGENVSYKNELKLLKNYSLLFHVVQFVCCW